MAAETGGRGEGTPERQARREMVWSNSTGKAYQVLVLDSRTRDGDHIVGMPQAPELDSQVLIAGQRDGIT
jgi:hypothetical protein